MSEWHLNWQRIFWDDWVEVRIKKDEVIHVADIMTNRRVQLLGFLHCCTKKGSVLKKGVSLF